MSDEIVYETWETTTAGGVWIYQVNDRGVEKPRRIKGKSGFKFRVTQRDREHSGARFYNSGQDPFQNGTFVRSDRKPEDVAKEIPGYDVDQALTDSDLIALFASSGNAFQSKVRKLNERNARRLSELAVTVPDAVSTAQEQFLTKHIVETFRAGGAPSDPED